MNQECPVCGAGIPCDGASEEPGLRDAFAIAGLLFQAIAFKDSPGEYKKQSSAHFAYEMADWMLIERKKK